MENEARPTEIPDGPLGTDHNDPEPSGSLSDHDRRYQFTAPDEPRRYGLIVAIAGALIGLILVTVIIANIADSTDSDATLAGPDAAQPEQSAPEQSPTFGSGRSEDGSANTASVGNSSTDFDTENSTENDTDIDASDNEGIAQAADDPTVPSLLGKQQGDIGAALTSLGIGFFLVEKSSETFTKGTVINTAPKAGQTISTSDTLTVFVSSGPASLQVPEVIGIEATTAVSRLTDAGLASKLIETPSSTADAGIVTASDPPVGSEIEAGTVVNLSVSTGPSAADCVEVPNVVGQKALVAKSLLALAGFDVVTEDVAHSAVADTVVSSSPIAGQCVDLGSSASIGVSCVSNIVPNVVGLAPDALSTAGFTVEEVTVQSDAVPAGTVLATTPTSGTLHCQSEPVIARVAAAATVASCDVAVPNLVGITALGAQLRAAVAGFSYQQTLAPSATVETGFVVSTTPAAGTVACAGSDLVVIVSSGSATTEPVDCSITLPSILFESEQQAVATIESVGLVASISNQPDDIIPAGLVSSWEFDRPDSNGQLCTGDQVFVTVSTGR